MAIALHQPNRAYETWQPVCQAHRDLLARHGLDYQHEQQGRLKRQRRDGVALAANWT